MIAAMAVILLLILVSCAPTAREQVLIREKAGVPEPARTASAPTTPSPSTPTENTPAPVVVLSPDIAALADKGKAQTNYKYSFSSRTRNQYGNYDEAIKFDLYYKDGYGKKVYLSPQKLRKDIFYNEVYVDFAKKTAVGVCTSAGTLCGSVPGNRAYSLDYDSQRPIVLLHLLEGILDDARNLRTGPFDNRRVMVVEYTNWQGKRELLSLDTFSGLPLQQEIYVTQGDEQILDKRYTFTGMNADSVKIKDVTLPANFVVE